MFCLYLQQLKAFNAFLQFNLGLSLKPLDILRTTVRNIKFPKLLEKDRL